MKVLHFYKKTDKRAEQYISVLAGAMNEKAEYKYCCNLRTFHDELKNWNPDIVHLHGCWHLSIAIAAKIAAQKHIRTVITPHGQLEPWIMGQHRWTEKIPKLIIYQYRTLQKASAIFAMGRMEANYLKAKNYNPNIEIVLNSLITDSINDKTMAQQVINVYQKVLDTNVLETMETDTRIVLKALIKAGITRNSKWLTNQEKTLCTKINAKEWHKIAVFSSYENINDVIGKGISAIQIPIATPLYETVDRYHRSKKNTNIKPLDYPSNNITVKFVTIAIETSKKHIKNGQFRIKQVIDMASMFMNNSIDEESLNNNLYELKLIKYASRLMHILSDMTGLEEGFLVLPARNDKTARKMETKILKYQ